MKKVFLLPLPSHSVPHSRGNQFLTQAFRYFFVHKQVNYIYKIYIYIERERRQYAFKHTKLLQLIWLFAILWTVVRQASLPMGILQARILEWAVMPLSRRSSQPMEWTHIFYVSYISMSITWDAPYMPIYTYKYVWLFLFMSLQHKW